MFDNIHESDNYEVGDKIISFLSEENKILIRIRRSFLVYWSIIFFTVPFFLVYRLFFSKEWPHHYMIYVISSLIITPFVIVGLRYFKESRSESIIIFDCQQESVSILPKINLNFDEISHLKLTHLIGVRSSSSKSYHVSLVLKNRKEITLIKCHSRFKIEIISQRISSETGIKLNDEFLPA